MNWDDMKIDDVAISFPKICPSFIFCDNDGKTIGKLTWDKGELSFEGQTNESAKVLFNYLKSYIDAYIKENR